MSLVDTCKLFSLRMEMNHFKFNLMSSNYNKLGLKPLIARHFTHLSKLGFLVCNNNYYKNLSYCISKESRLFSNVPVERECPFSIEEQKKCIERLKRFKILHKPSSAKLKNAAVLIPLCSVNGEPSLLYTLRRQDLNTHKGQVSFPGGKEDSNDASLEVTALRETEEELNIHRSTVDVWGHGNSIAARDFNILPVVGYLGEIAIDNLNPNPSEVDLVFSLPLSHFYNEQNCRYTQYRNPGYILPVYINGKCKIWGITALITHFVLKSLSPKKYHHELHFIKPLL